MVRVSRNLSRLPITANLAWTVGDPDSYEKVIRTEGAVKGIGGAAFVHQESAESFCIAYRLPWKAYQIVLLAPFREVTSRDTNIVRPRYHAWRQHLDPYATCKFCRDENPEMMNPRLPYDALIEFAPFVVPANEDD